MNTVPPASIHTTTIPSMNQEWAQVLHYATFAQYPKGYTLMLEKGNNGKFCYLESGRICILHGAVNGKTHNMLYLEPGNLFNVSAVLGSIMTSYEDPGTQFYCLQPVRIWYFPGLLLSNPDFICAHPHLIANLMASLGVKLLIMHNTLSQSGTGSTITKVCRFALNLMQAQHSTTLYPALSQAEMANLFGIHRATLLRALQLLKQMDVIRKLTKNSLIIGDIEKLRALAEG